MMNDMIILHLYCTLFKEYAIIEQQLSSLSPLKVRLAFLLECIRIIVQLFEHKMLNIMLCLNR
jgi:hypothetical protein